MQNKSSKLQCKMPSNKLLAVLFVMGSAYILIFSLLDRSLVQQGKQLKPLKIEEIFADLTLNDEERKKMNADRNKPHLTVFIAILNKVTSFARRDAVRSTWMSDCNAYNGKVVCRFFTDSPDTLSKLNGTKVEKEYLEHQDMVFMPYKGGYNFAIRLVWILEWVTKHYTFDYFLRIDDDQFLCLDRLIYELPYRPKNSLYWGFIHCRHRIVRVDEGWLMLSSNLVYEALSKLNTSLPCHPFGDQAVALWMLDSKYRVTYFFDNDRVINLATAFKEKIYLRPDICEKYLSLHGSYPKLMKKYWDITNLTRIATAHKSKHYDIPGIPRYEDKCSFSNKVFDVTRFWPAMRFDTKPCKDEPTWHSSDTEFPSREVYGEDD